MALFQASWRNLGAIWRDRGAIFRIAPITVQFDTAVRNQSVRQQALRRPALSSSKRLRNAWRLKSLLNTATGTPPMRRAHW